MANKTQEAEIKRLVAALEKDKDGDRIIRELGEPIVVMRIMARAIMLLQQQVKELSKR